MPATATRSITISVLFCAGAYAQTVGSITFQGSPNSQQPGQQQPQGPVHTVTGTVTNALTNEPIRRALVQMQGMHPASALTGSDGRFQFENVPEGGVFFVLQKPGYSDPRFPMFGGRSFGVNQLTVGSGSNDFPLKMLPNARISGTVSDSDGQPVENVSLQVLSEMIMQGRKQWLNRMGASTDDDGFFRVEDLPPGRYSIYASGRAVPAANLNAARQVLSPAYYPDAADQASAQPIDLQAGQEFRADFHLHLDRAYRVTAQVGGVPEGTRLAFSLQGPSRQRTQFAGSHYDANRGQFTAEAIPSGSWVLSFFGQSQQGQQVQGRTEFAVDHADITNLQVSVHVATAIPIQVVDPIASQIQDNEPPSEGKGRSRGRFAGVPFQAWLVAPESTEQKYFASPGATPGEQQSVAFQNVPPGKYKLRIQSLGNGCVESATYGGTDLAHGDLVISEGATQPITVTMGASCSSLSVGVQTGDHPGSQAASILVIPSASFLEPFVLQVPVGQQQPGAMMPMNASFSLAPGSYQVFAFTNADGLEYANPEALRSYRSQSITLDAGQKMDLKVEINERASN